MNEYGALPGGLDISIEAGVAMILGSLDIVFGEIDR